MLHRIVYSSAASPDLSSTDLESMLAESRIRNRAHGITGVLVLVDGAFLQVLEGEQQEVLALMARIARDPRHHDVKVFHREDIGARAFSGWSMAYLTASPTELARWAQLEGATTIGDVLASVEGNPDRLPDMLVRILRAIAVPPQA
jgi:hypothetical protein